MNVFTVMQHGGLVHTYDAACMQETLGWQNCSSLQQIAGAEARCCSLPSCCRAPQTMAEEWEWLAGVCAHNSWIWPL